MQRIIGSVCLICAALTAGVWARKNDREHVLLLWDVAAMIQHARRKIDLFGTPTDDLFSDFKEYASNSLRIALNKKNNSEVFKSIIDFLGDDSEPFKNFYRDLGVGYKQDALNVCDYTLSKITERAVLLEKRFSARKNLYISLPLLLAVSVIVLLL
ncbi:MAG: hypothetical protein IKB87_02885 [Clostridia bacterium]|nr:hypothetical protein [Clostridia bacterium]